MIRSLDSASGAGDARYTWIRSRTTGTLNQIYINITDARNKISNAFHSNEIKFQMVVTANFFDFPITCNAANNAIL